LRHPLVASSLRGLADGRWQPVLDRQPAPNTALPPADSIRRLILCSGKVYIDLLTSELMPEHPEVGVARIEQLAPFPLNEVRDLLAGYTKLKEVIWLQEEPENMGAWEFARPYLDKAIAGRVPLRLVSRPRSASPAEGSNAMHIRNQKRLVEWAIQGSEQQTAVDKPAAERREQSAAQSKGEPEKLKREEPEIQSRQPKQESG
jgi:2-oxoglutarate dehydrogenase E1 component